MIRFIPRPWNCTPPLPGRLGLKYYPLSLAIATSSRAEGEGTRFFWIDPLTRISHHSSTAATLCRTLPDFHSVRALNIV